MNKTSTLIIAVVIGLILIGSVLSIQQNSQPPTPTPTASTNTNNQMQLDTFYIDELGEPLDENNLETATLRNESRIEDVNEQIDEDISFIEELATEMESPEANEE